MNGITERPKITISDDDLKLNKASSILLRVSSWDTKKQIFTDALIALASKYRKRFTSDDIDFFDRLTDDLHKKQNRKETYSIYKARNAIKLIFEMVVSGIEYKSIDEKKKKLLKQLEWNRHNPTHKQFLRSLNHKAYDVIKRKAEYARVHLDMTNKQISNMGFENIMKLKDVVEVSSNKMPKHNVTKVRRITRGKHDSV